jgi:hypothetical protein
MENEMISKEIFLLLILRSLPENVQPLHELLAILKKVTKL